MMHGINNRLKHLSLFLLPALVWLITNSTINTHTHILTVGIEISHAHPYNKNTSQTNPYPGHQHTRGELIFLDLISHPLTLLTFVLAELILATKIQVVTFCYIPPFTIKEHYNVLNYHAPPTHYI